MSKLQVSDSIKMLQETFCVAQTRIGNSDDPRAREHVDRLQRLIHDCMRQRPVGTDGKHGVRHTRTCGCEDGQLGLVAWAWRSIKRLAPSLGRGSA